MKPREFKCADGSTTIRLEQGRDGVRLEWFGPNVIKGAAVLPPHEARRLRDAIDAALDDRFERYGDESQNGRAA